MSFLNPKRNLALPHAIQRRVDEMFAGATGFSGPEMISYFSRHDPNIEQYPSSGAPSRKQILQDCLARFPLERQFVLLADMLRLENFKKYSPPSHEDSRFLMEWIESQTGSSLAPSANVRGGQHSASWPAVSTAQEPTVADAPSLASAFRPRIFISYRRDDSQDVAGRVYDRLSAHFGRERVFKDVDSIPFGVDFRDHLNKAVSECSILLALIGKSWLAGRRIDSPEDFVRIEIEAALTRGIQVIPVLVNGASVPSSIDLPQALQPLVYRNAAQVRQDPDFHNDIQRLIRGMENHSGQN